MKTSIESKISLEQLSHLPFFAQYLLQHRLQDFVDTQWRYSEEIEIPLMQFLKKLPKEHLEEFALNGAIEFLSYLAENKAKLQIEHSVRQWKDNELPILKKEEIAADDITMITYLRKKTFLHFIPDYCNTADQMLELIKEIDLFLTCSETALTNTYINLLKSKISDDSLLIEKVNHTIPGAVYVFDVQNFKGVYSNHKLGSIIGYPQNELNVLAEATIKDLIHPHDQVGIMQHIESLKHAKDGEIRIFKYRVKDRKGNYRWLANHESIFRRDEQGEVLQTIGITLDIDKEERTAIALRENEDLRKQAESITHIGHYTWLIGSNELKWSDEIFRIYGFDPEKDVIDFSVIERYTHPEDLQIVQRETQNAIANKSSFDFYYRITTIDGAGKTLHALGNVLLDENKEPRQVLGTVQDVTEKLTLIEKLKHNESIYKQAEELASMGNWSLDLKTNRIQWTDQLYRIYGMQPQSEEITIERFLSFVHPDDREYVSGGVDEMTKESILDYTFRIITKDGMTKILRSVAQVQKDQNGNPVMVVGTERDVTEKQNLITRLRKSENLYKQAQALAHVGNWSWDIEANQIEWSDELYRIYGSEPRDIFAFDEYLSFVHPDDRERVRKMVEAAIESNEPWSYTHKVQRKSGEVRIVYATGEVLTGEKGKPYMMIGTAQDVTERQMLIDRLQESERLFKQAQALAHLGNWSIDLNSRQFTWSEEMYRIYEIDPDTQLTFDDWTTFIHPEEKEEVVSYYENAIRDKKLYDRTHRIVLSNGKVKTIHRKGDLIFNEDGEPVKMVGTTQDVTEEYRVQQELKENQTFIRKITDATPSIIASYNVNTGRYVFISEGLEKLLGYDRKLVDELGVNFFIGIVHPDDLQEMGAKNAAALEEANAHPEKNDMVVEFTYRMKHSNGQYRWFHTYGTIFDRNSENKVEHVLNISLDVTEQMAASEKIKEQEHFIQQIADASPTILYLYNVENQSIEYINREIFFVLGYLPEEVVDAGEAITTQLYHPEDYHLLPARKESGKNFQQVDSMIQYECRMKNKEGEWRWLLVREIVFKTDESGNITQILGAAFDINRRKEMERTILQNTLLLEQSNASLEEFAYVASHDLKEPLRKISTFGDRMVATQEANLTPEGKIYLRKIIDASQRMQTMINDLLSISMISGNTSFERYSLQKIFEETIQTLEFKIEQQNAIITSDPLPEANIIPSQFRQLFQNLLSNSLKFTRPGVQPKINIKHVVVSAHDLVHYQLSQAPRYHKIEFSDNGIGFENEFAGKIFAIFQRLHGRSEYEGSGIGLAICKKIVEHHGGIIYANGDPEKGAVFTIILPE